MSTAPRREYRVRYRRADWAYARTRVFQSPNPAIRLARRLLRNDRFDLSDVVLVEVEAREVGPWQPVNWRGEP